MIPEGMRDVLPPETGRLRAVEDQLRARFAAYGYGEVRTSRGWSSRRRSASADDDTLAAGYRLHDEQGHELIVRTDMTGAGRAHCGGATTIRCLCASSTSRPASAPGRRSAGQDGEFVQAGVSSSGSTRPGRRRVRDAALRRARRSVCASSAITLGSVAFQRALIDSLGLDPPTGRSSSRRSPDRDYPLVESIAANAGARARRARSPVADARTQRRRRQPGAGAQAGAERHGRSGRRASAGWRDLVGEAGFGERLAFDFGLMHDLTYYLLAFVFEAYAPRVGLPLATGGRYDHLVQRFGWDVPGVGFAIAVDRARRGAGRSRAGAGRRRRRSPSSGVSRSRRGRRSFVAPVSLSAPCRRARPAAPPPLLVGAAARYVLRLADGRDRQRELARRSARLGVGVEDRGRLWPGAPAGRASRSARGGRSARSLTARPTLPPGVCSRRAMRRGCSRPPPDVLRACDRGGRRPRRRRQGFAARRSPRRGELLDPGAAATTWCTRPRRRREPARAAARGDASSRRPHAPLLRRVLRPPAG